MNHEYVFGQTTIRKVQHCTSVKSKLLLNSWVMKLIGNKLQAMKLHCQTVSIWRLSAVSIYAARLLPLNTPWHFLLVSTNGWPNLKTHVSHKPSHFWWRAGSGNKMGMLEAIKTTWASRCYYNNVGNETNSQSYMSLAFFKCNGCNSCLNVVPQNNK